jgi:protein disulfide-isomerase
VDGVSDYKRSVIDSRFAKWAGMLFLLSLDYPRRTPQALEVKKNRMMNCSKLSVQGFPTIYFANGYRCRWQSKFVKV